MTHVFLFSFVWDLVLGARLRSFYLYNVAIILIFLNREQNKKREKRGKNFSHEK